MVISHLCVSGNKPSTCRQLEPQHIPKQSHCFREKAGHMTKYTTSWPFTCTAGLSLVALWTQVEGCCGASQSWNLVSLCFEPSQPQRITSGLKCIWNCLQLNIEGLTLFIHEKKIVLLHNLPLHFDCLYMEIGVRPTDLKKTDCSTCVPYHCGPPEARGWCISHLHI